MIQKDTPFASFRLKDGVVIGIYPENLEIDKETAIRIVNDRLEFFNNQQYPLLIDGRKLKSINWAAREYFASEEGKAGILAVAMLADSRLTIYIGNFFLKITDYSRDFPVRLFSDMDTALAWLMQYRERK